MVYADKILVMGGDYESDSTTKSECLNYWSYQNEIIYLTNGECHTDFDVFCFYLTDDNIDWFLTCDKLITGTGKQLLLHINTNSEILSKCKNNWSIIENPFNMVFLKYN